MNRRVLELIVLATCAFLLTSALLSAVLEPGASPEEGNPIWRTILSVSYLSVALILVPYYREVFYVLRRNWSLTALLLLALVSCVWAYTPSLVLRRSIAALGASLFGLALSVRFSPRDQLRFLSWLFRVIAVLSLISVIFVPSYGISEGEWRGVFQHKNILGSFMALSVLVEWHLDADSPQRRFVNRLMLIISAVLLIFSRSVTPQIALIASLVFVTIYNIATQRFRIPLYVIVAAALVMLASGITILFGESSLITDALGKSSDLTGRTEIWSAALSFVHRHPFLGYGYWGFWSGASPDSTAVERLMGISIMYSHNGYVEILLTLGAVGLTLALVFLGGGIKRAYESSRINQFGVEFWPIALLLFVILHNIGECTILVQDLEWSICVATVISTDARLFAPAFEAQQKAVFALDE